MRIPAVSVVMGVFNSGNQLAATLRSVLDQQGCDIEFIVVDDGSTDNAPQVLESFADHDSRLTIIRQPNAGLTRALMVGCAAASAAFIARQDVGDISMPGRLQMQAQALTRHDEVTFVSCCTEYFEPKGAFLFRSAGSGRASIPLNVLDADATYGISDGPSHHGSVMFRRDAYLRAGGYRPQFYFGQDWDLWYRLAEQGKFLMLPEALYRANVGVGDISTTRKPMQEKLAGLSLEAARLRAAGRSEAEILVCAAKVRPSAPSETERRLSTANANYFLGECLRRNGDVARASEYFAEAIRNRPWHLKAWARLFQARSRAATSRS
jgi:glycosyltransferase involved in cell wall biosynthesis